jgi:hypothetical protein
MQTIATFSCLLRLYDDPAGSTGGGYPSRYARVEIEVTGRCDWI